MKYIAIINSDEPLTEHAIQFIKDTIFCGDEQVPYVFEIEDIKYDDITETIIKALEQKPFINKPCCVSSEICEHYKNEVLNKIRAEIEDERVRDDWDFGNEIFYNNAIDDVLQIIDKYREESEDNQ